MARVLRALHLALPPENGFERAGLLQEKGFYFLNVISFHCIYLHDPACFPC